MKMLCPRASCHACFVTCRNIPLGNRSLPSTLVTSAHWISIRQQSPQHFDQHWPQPVPPKPLAPPTLSYHWLGTKHLAGLAAMAKKMQCHRLRCSFTIYSSRGRNTTTQPLSPRRPLFKFGVLRVLVAFFFTRAARHSESLIVLNG